MWAWVILGLCVAFAAVALWLHWRALQAEGRAEKERRDADEAQEDKRREEDLRREEERDPDEVLDEFERRFGNRRTDSAQ